MNKLISVFVLSLGVFFSLPLPSGAAEPNFGNSVVAYQESFVPVGQSVKNVLLIGKDGVIAGEVKDEVVIIKGSLTLKKTAKVADRVFIIGGELRQEPGAQVGKGVFNISTSNATVNSMLIGVVTFAGIELFKLVLSISLIISALIVVIVAPTVAKKSAESLKGGLLKSAVLGTLGLLCFGLLTAALATSIWGIPLAVLLVLLLIFLVILGYTGMGLVFGELFKKGLESSLQSTMLITGVGTLFLVAILNLPIVGPVWGMIVVVLALGSTIQVIFRRKPKN